MTNHCIPKAPTAALARSIDPVPYARPVIHREGLTRTQHQMLDYVRIFMLMNDEIPPLGVIAAAFTCTEYTVMECLVELETAGHLARNSLGHLMLANPSRRHAAPMQLRALQKLAEDLIHPEEFGHAVTPEIRDRAREALGMRACETGNARVASYGACA